MTAKEDLRERVEQLSEAEAAGLLASLDSLNSQPALIPGELDKYPPEERGRRLRAMFDAWHAKGDYMTEEEWEEFARAVDSHRPHRPLFSQYLNDSGSAR